MSDHAGWLLIVLVGIAKSLLPAACAPAPIAATSIVPSLSPIAEPPTLIPTRAAAERAPTHTREVRPTETEKPIAPTPTIIFNPHSSEVWDRIPNIVIAAKKDDSRIAAAHQAVDFWNAQLNSIGKPFRFGFVTESYSLNPDDLVPPKYLVVDRNEQLAPTFSEIPEVISSLHGDITIAVTDYELTSRTIFEWQGGQIVRNGRVAIFISTNPPNSTIPYQASAFIHELGHALGLGHDNYPLSVMCGPPWRDTCRQRAVVLPQDQLFVLSLYPANWKPTR